MPKYEEMHTFSKMGMSKNSRNDNLTEIKAPVGASWTWDSFWELTPDELIHVPDNLKKLIFPVWDLLVALFHIPTFFYRKPKWSVWSLCTHSPRWILKFVIEKWVLDENWTLKISKNWTFHFRGPTFIFEGLSKTNMTFKNILDHSAIIPAQFPYIKIWFSIELTQNPKKSIKF